MFVNRYLTLTVSSLLFESTCLNKHNIDTLIAHNEHLFEFLIAYTQHTISSSLDENAALGLTIYVQH